MHLKDYGGCVDTALCTLLVLPACILYARGASPLVLLHASIVALVSVLGDAQQRPWWLVLDRSTATSFALSWTYFSAQVSLYDSEAALVSAALVAIAFACWFFAWFYVAPSGNHRLAVGLHRLWHAFLLAAGTVVALSWKQPSI